jgi:hypothetical protein
VHGRSAVDAAACKAAMPSSARTLCAYRPVRDREGRIISAPSHALNNPEAAAQIIAPLVADQPVEMFAVACLSACNRILAWHVVSQGTRSSTPVSIPDGFVPACVTQAPCHCWSHTIIRLAIRRRARMTSFSRRASNLQAPCSTSRWPITLTAPRAILFSSVAHSLRT